VYLIVKGLVDGNYRVEIYIHLFRAGLTSREARGRFSARGPQPPPPPPPPLPQYENLGALNAQGP
jgi:hypothetical protein